MSIHTGTSGMLSACLEWLADWTADLPPMIDEYDLEAWMESEGCEAVSFFLQTAFRKSKTRQEALEIIRGLLWEWFLSQRDAALATLPQNAEGVQAILAAPQTPQKTAAWYAESRDLLTGHEFAAVVLGTPAAFSTAVAKKCGAAAVLEEGGEDAEIESRTVYTSPLNPFQWGWRYEPVIRSLYETEVAKAPVVDTLGRIRHRTLPRLAASPDGLILEGKKAGRLLEIKAPKTRILNGQVPAEYYCQMQLQAEVADVPAVEYVEVRFDARDASLFLETSEDEENREECRKRRETFVLPTSSIMPQRMGCVLVISPNAEAPAESWTYAYSPLFDLGPKGLEDALCWKPENLAKEAVVLERSIWRIEDWWTTTVPRNQRWWTEVGQPAYESFWEAVDIARSEGTYSSCLIVDEED